jgi:signal transduction histidine kinase
MTGVSPYKDAVPYLVGAERGILDILRAEDIRPLLKGAVLAGAAEALLVLNDGTPVCVESGPAGSTDREISSVVQLEGEPVGSLLVRGSSGDKTLDGIAMMLSQAVRTVLLNNMKRMLTTEMHTSLISQSYDELLEKNRALEASEARYRELAESLEVKVRERTVELQVAHTRLLQQEKLASVGQLAAGVAHEINNPLGFITSNLSTLQKYVGKFIAMLDWYEEKLANGVTLDMLHDGALLKKRELKLQLVREDVSELLVQSIAGAERVKKIVADLKGFSHVDQAGIGEIDLNGELERTLSVLAHQFPTDAEVIRDYSPLPTIKGFGGVFCQLFAALIQNACQARPVGLRLAISTSCQSGEIQIVIADNGPGVPEVIRGRIFEPFFTTREVGAGTGMGLAVAYDAIRSSGGSIAVEDATGGGAKFVVKIPLDADVRAGR